MKHPALLVRIGLLLAVVSALSADERGEPSVLRGVFGVALLFFGPLIGGVILGFLQLGVYRILVKSKVMLPDSVPMFPILVMRGLIALIAVIAITMFWLKASGRALPLTG